MDENTAEFPINIDFNIRANLDSVFAVHTAGNHGPKLSHSNVVSPFAGPNPYIPLSPLPRVKGGSSWQPSSAKSRGFVSVREDGGDGDRVGDGIGEGGGKVREEFDRTVFDAAERSIKYLVVTNTWRKFVGEQQARGCAGAV